MIIFFSFRWIKTTNMFLNGRRRNDYFFHLLGFLYQSKGNIIFRKDVCLADPTKNLFKSLSQFWEIGDTGYKCRQDTSSILRSSPCLVLCIPLPLLLCILQAQEGSPNWPYQASFLANGSLQLTLSYLFHGMQHWRDREGIFFSSIPNSPV